jgi:hypothetical protein
VQEIQIRRNMKMNIKSISTGSRTPTGRRPEFHAPAEADGRRCVFLGRDIEVRLRESGRGRFTKLGMPFPHFTATFVGWLEIVGGLMLLSGLMTRLDRRSLHY